MHSDSPNGKINTLAGVDVILNKAEKIRCKEETLLKREAADVKEDDCTLNKPERRIACVEFQLPIYLSSILYQ